MAYGIGALLLMPGDGAMNCSQNAGSGGNVMGHEIYFVFQLNYKLRVESLGARAKRPCHGLPFNQ
jgi:hypothetical protein